MPLPTPRRKGAEAPTRLRVAPPPQDTWTIRSLLGPSRRQRLWSLPDLLPKIPAKMNPVHLVLTRSRSRGCRGSPGQQRSQLETHELERRETGVAGPGAQHGDAQPPSPLRGRLGAGGQAWPRGSGGPEAVRPRP